MILKEIQSWFFAKTLIFRNIRGWLRISRFILENSKFLRFFAVNGKFCDIPLTAINTCLCTLVVDLSEWIQIWRCKSVSNSKGVEWASFLIFLTRHNSMAVFKPSCSKTSIQVLIWIAGESKHHESFIHSLDGGLNRPWIFVVTCWLKVPSESQNVANLPYKLQWRSQWGWGTPRFGTNSAYSYWKRSIVGRASIAARM